MRWKLKSVPLFWFAPRKQHAQACLTGAAGLLASMSIRQELMLTEAPWSLHHSTHERILSNVTALEYSAQL